MNFIDKLKELEAKATPGPWAWAGESKKEDDINGSDGYAVICRDSGVYPPDADTGDLIITMRNCLPELLALASAVAEYEHAPIAQGKMFLALRALEAKVGKE